LLAASNYSHFQNCHSYLFVGWAWAVALSYGWDVWVSGTETGRIETGVTETGVTVSVTWIWTETEHAYRAGSSEQRTVVS